MKNLYNNLSNREKKLIFVSLSLLVILIVFWSVNTVALKISVLKNQYQTSSSEYSYVLNKAKIISRSLSSAQIGLLESDIKVFFENNELLSDLEFTQPKFYQDNNNSVVALRLLDLKNLLEIVNELSLFYQKNPETVKIESSESSDYLVYISF
ncbi:MAG: hypothetical protein VX139_04080 [Pseudomonadota bacterium]|nr:hypothetical protein [Pseudomonadota bacterium]